MPKKEEDRRHSDGKAAADKKGRSSSSLRYALDDVSEEAYFRTFATTPLKPKPPPTTSIAFHPRGERKIRREGPPNGTQPPGIWVGKKKYFSQHHVSSKVVAVEPSGVPSRSNSARKRPPVLVEPRVSPGNAVTTKENSDDADLIAQKLPRGRRRYSSRGAVARTSLASSKASAEYNLSSSLRNSRSRDQQHIVREKLPKGRPDNFSPPHAAVSNSKPKTKAVKASKVEIIPDPTTDEPLRWDEVRALAAPTLPVAHMAEPSSAGGLESSLSARQESLEIAQGHVLPAGRDTVSSYNNLRIPGIMDQDAITRAAEASVLSYCTALEHEMDQDAVAKRVGTTTASQAFVDKQVDTLSENERQQQQHHHQKTTKNENIRKIGKPQSSREAQKIQLQQDLQDSRRHAEISKSSRARTTTATSHPRREAGKLRHGRPRHGRQFSKILEEGNEDETVLDGSESATVAQRNSGLIRQVSPAGASVELVPEANNQKRCCLAALFGRWRK